MKVKDLCIQESVVLFLFWKHLFTRAFTRAVRAGGTGARCCPWYKLLQSQRLSERFEVLSTAFAAVTDDVTHIHGVVYVSKCLFCQSREVELEATRYASTVTFIGILQL